MKAFRWFLPALLLTMLAACRSTLVTDLVTQSGGTLYQDDFSDPASGWSRASSQSGVMDYDNGTFRMLVLASNYDLWSTAGQSFQDVHVEVDAVRLGGPLENRFGLVCRYRDAKNFYFFIISSDGYYSIGKVSRGVRSLLGQEMMAYNPAIFPGVGPNHLRFDCVGQNLTGAVNGQILAAVVDADLPNGDTGLLAGTFAEPGADIAFDNFKVTKP